jgi:hypothetical protein
MAKKKFQAQSVQALGCGFCARVSISFRLGRYTAKWIGPKAL